MGNVILLTGSPGCGKTTIIKQIINEYSGEMGGFYTEEMREGGVRTGFRMITCDGQTGILAHVKFQRPTRVGKYGVDLGTLEEIGVKSIYETLAGKGLVVIDEIGPMEIASAKFRSAINDVILSGNPMVATIVKRSMPFTDEIKRRCTNLIEIGARNRESAARQILTFLSKVKIDE